MNQFNDSKSSSLIPTESAIKNLEEALQIQKSRNFTSLEYGKQLSEKSYQLAVYFLPLAKKLFEVLRLK